MEDSTECQVFTFTLNQYSDGYSLKPNISDSHYICFSFGHKHSSAPIQRFKAGDF